MGLENGILIKKTYITQKFGLDDFYNDDSERDNTLEVCYWRKCRGLRDDIINHLQKKYSMGEGDVYNWTLDTEDIKKILNIVKSWQNKKKWNIDGHSIWFYKEIKEQLMQDRENLSYLLATMTILYDNTLDVRFYDSY